MRSIPPLYSQDGKPDAVVYAKVFDPAGRYTAYITEADPQDGRLFGYVVSALGPDCDELGYLDLAELEAVRNPLGLALERDHRWAPAPLAAVMRGEVR